MDVECGFLDNDFSDPDLNRFLNRFRELEPSVAVVGDAYSEDDAIRFEDAIRTLEDEGYEHNRFIVVPKTQSAAESLSTDIIRGYANGYSDIQAEDIGLQHFRDVPIHILGSGPLKQYNAIQKLTQPRLDGLPPADIVGADWNGYMFPSFAEPGEYWTPNGWKQDLPGKTPRQTCRKSLNQIKQFWEEKDMWPELEPCELYGEAVIEPDDPVYGLGGDIKTREDLETAVIEEYDDRGTIAYRSETRKQFVEYRDGLTQRTTGSSVSD